MAFEHESPYFLILVDVTFDIALINQISNDAHAFVDILFSSSKSNSPHNVLECNLIVAQSFCDLFYEVSPNNDPQLSNQQIEPSLKINLLISLQRLLKQCEIRRNERLYERKVLREWRIIRSRLIHLP